MFIMLVPKVREGSTKKLSMESFIQEEFIYLQDPKRSVV